MTLYRKLLHKVPEVEVLKQAGTDNVEALITAAQLRWAGHVKRMPDERIPKLLLYGELQLGKRKTEIQGCIKTPPEEKWSGRCPLRGTGPGPT